MKTLIVEDDPATLAFIANGLRQQGHVVDEAADGLAGLELATQSTYDVMVIDRMLPGCSGLELIRSARSEGVVTPILMLTAIKAVEDRVEGLNAGADDYLAKPFAFSELSARLSALMRRPPLTAAPRMIRVGDLEIDPTAHQASRAGQRIDLTPAEFKLIEFLARRAGQVVTRTMLLEALWGFHFDPRTNIIDAHVSRLRSKIDKGFDVSLIRTLRGVGYVLEAQD